LRARRERSTSPAAGRDRGRTTKDVDPDRFLTPLDHPEIWLKQGDPTIYFSPPG